MIDFKTAVEKTLIFEGGYVDDPDDAGGETNFGISKRSYPDLDIKNLTVGQAKEIYYRDYWQPVRAESLRHQRLAESVFDFGVNSGKRRASKYLQFAINLLVTDKRLNRLAIDGYIGLRTTRRLYYVNDLDRLFLLYSFNRLIYYRKLARRSSQRDFLYSWIRRITD